MTQSIHGRLFTAFHNDLLASVIRTYGMQYQLSSPKHNELMKLFHQICEGSGIMHNNSKIFEYLYSFEEKNSPIQLNLFD